MVRLISCFVFLFLRVFLSHLFKKKKGGGPWTMSIQVVHGPGPEKGSMDAWSMFCPYPVMTWWLMICKVLILFDNINNSGSGLKN